MKTYHLSSANRSAEHYIMFSYGVSLRLSNYLFNSKPVARDFFEHLKGTTQRGLTDKHLDNLDYFKGLGAYHIVSKRFVEAMKSYLKEDVTFHAMQVSGRNTSHDLYLLQVNKTLPIIKETSFDLNNDRVFSPPIFKKNHDISFLIAREENVLMNHIVIVSDEFVSLCARHQLKINFRQTLTE